MKPEDNPDRQRTGRKSVFPMRRVKLTEPDDSGKRSFEGYASVFGNRDLDGDIVVKGAFRKTLVERPELKVLWQHDTKLPIGLGTAYEDDYGLVARGVLTNTRFVKEEVVPLLEDGVVSGLSIGYDIEEDEPDPGEQAWLLKALNLFEFSPVTFAANELASVQVVKSLDSRQDQHLANVARYAKSLMHEMEGFFGHSDRQEALQCEELDQLGALIAGKQRGTGTEAADARDSRDQWFYDRGVQDCLDLRSVSP